MPGVAAPHPKLFQGRLYASDVCVSTELLIMFYVKEVSSFSEHALGNSEAQHSEMVLTVLIEFRSPFKKEG